MVIELSQVKQIILKPIFAVVGYLMANTNLNSSLMKIVILTLTLFVSGSLNAQISQSIVEVGCQLIAPDTLKYFPKTIKTELGELVLHQYKCKKEINGQIVTFALQYCDYPTGTIHHDSTDLLNDFFKVTAESSAKTVFGVLDYSSLEPIYGYPGMIWRVSFDNDKGLIKSKAFVRNNRYFNLKVEYPRSLSVDSSIDQFLSSFRWL